MRRVIIAMLITILFCMQPLHTPASNLVDYEEKNTYISDTIFNGSGYVQNDVYTSDDGETHVTKPEINWNVNNPGLMTEKTGSCSVAIDSQDSVWLIGGRIDPNPSQSNDELPISSIDLYDNANDTWVVSPTVMPNTQQYCEAEIIGDQIFVVGDWPRGSSNPPVTASGMVQIYNMTNETWYEGEFMPSGAERGNGGMAEAGGYLYYAGGVRNQAGTDATNQTYRYDPVTDNWTRMADMHQPRAAFELVNFHGQLYAMGGYQGTSTWNRQALDYVERYDPATDTWTNLSSLPKAMFGWGSTILNDEIILVGGFDGSPQKSVYHYNPLTDKWHKGKNIVSGGHFDVQVEEINGDIIWASGDRSGYAYSSWNQILSDYSEYQNFAGNYTGIVNSPIIDLRPNQHSTAYPVQISLNGSNVNDGEITFQYRVGSTTTTVSNSQWVGPDGTINSSFSLGNHNLGLNDFANFLQYRISLKVNDMENWGEPDLDSISVYSEHASFNSSLPTVINPRSETVSIQTSHGLMSQGTMYVQFASCNALGGIISPWSTIYFDGVNSSHEDPNNMLLDSYASINSTSIDGTNVDWYFDFSELTGVTHLCSKVGTNATKVTEYLHSNLIEINNSLSVIITGMDGLNIGDSTIGGIPLNVNLEHIFKSTGMTISSGQIQARLNFDTRIVDVLANNYTSWQNYTTPWFNLSAGQADKIEYNLPEDISGNVYISVESRSDLSFNMQSDSNSTWIILDNENPVIISSNPSYGSYVNSAEDRDISLLIGDNSGFNMDSLIVETWIESLDDGADGSFPDGIPQFTEYREINHTLENLNSHWWFNITQSDNMNMDHQKVYVRILLDDLVDSPLENNTIWWSTRDARNAVIDSIVNTNQNDIWEVSRNIGWTIMVSDDNSVNDILNIKLEIGDDSEFGIEYDVAARLCSTLDLRIDPDSSTCSHSIENGNLSFTVDLFANWDIDLSLLQEGELEFTIEDVDGKSITSFSNMWTFSDQFDFTLSSVMDVTGSTTGELTSSSIVMIDDSIQITGTLNHYYSGLEYNGDLSVKWWGTLQGDQWLGGSYVEVIDGQINATIPMPTTGGIMQMNVAFLDPWETRTLGSFSISDFVVDDSAPVILMSSIETYSRYHLESVNIGVNIEESVSWSNNLTLKCMVVSTEVQWEEIEISLPPNNVFQGKTLFSFEFDFSGQGDPSQLSPESRIDCWANGLDDSGWGLTNENGNPMSDVWLSIPLNDIGPNINLKNVEVNGEPNPGSDVRLDVVIYNDGESLFTPFNITVYTTSDGTETLTGRYTQAELYSGQTITKRLSVTVPEGDWSVRVEIDEDNQIWELNEEDNTFTSDFQAPEQMNTGLIVGGAIGLIGIIAVIIVLRGRRDDELSLAKKQNESSESDISPPNIVRAQDAPTRSKPKSGPPPKKEVPSISSQNAQDISEAMAKLSLTDLPGRSENQKVSSYESLPAGGEYEYAAEATYYSGENIGKWKLESDGSFTKIE